MSVNFIQQPGEIVFSKNPVEFTFKTDNVYASAGRPFSARLFFSYVPDTGNAFTLKYDTLELTFSFAAAADDSGTILTRGNGLTLAAFYTQLAGELKQNYYLDRDFIISSAADGVRFTARKNATEYALSITTNYSISLTTTQAAEPAVVNDNFKLMAELWAMRFSGTEYERVSTVFLEVDNNGEALYDISDSLTNYLCAAGYDSPSLTAAVFEKAGKNTCRYYLRYAEVYGKKQVVRKVHQSEIKYAALGGFSKRMIGELAFPGYFITGDKVKFLKQSGASNEVKPAMPNWLYWLNFLGAAAADVWVKVTYSDESTLDYKAYQFAGLSKYEKLVIPCGALQLGVPLQDALKVPVQYDVVLKSGEVELSERKTFYLRYKYDRDAQFYVYQNSFGGYDGIVTFGKKSREYDIVAESANRGSSGSFNFEAGERLEYLITAQYKEAVTTGYRSKAEIRGWKDFFLSRDRYCLKGKLAYPVSLASKNIKEFKDGDTLFALSFELAYAYVDELFTAGEVAEEVSYSSSDLVNWIPPVAEAPPANFDDRYYLKTEVYNRAQVDQLLFTIQNSFSGLDASVQAQIAAILTQLADKAPLHHDHGDIYVNLLQVMQMTMQVFTLRAPWSVEDSLDDLYVFNCYTEHNGKFYRSLVEANRAEPGTDPLKWQAVTGGRPYSLCVRVNRNDNLLPVPALAGKDVIDVFRGTAIEVLTVGDAGALLSDQALFDKATGLFTFGNAFYGQEELVRIIAIDNN